MRTVELLVLVILQSGAAVLSAAAAPLRAQDQPLALVHGFNSDGSSWQVAAERLRHDFKVAPERPNLTWRAKYTDQAIELNSRVTPEVQMAIGHSNGGLVSRAWNRRDSRLDRLATMGSLHRGAPLADHTLNGDVYRVGGAIAYDISDAVRYYAYWEMMGVDNTLGYLGYWGLYNIFNWYSNLAELVAAHGFEMGVGTGLAIPVVYDASPTFSTILPSLNSDSSLAREARAMVARVGIVSDTGTGLNQMFYTLSPDDGDAWVLAREFAYGASLAAYEYYQYHLDPWSTEYYYQLQSGAWRWALVALDMLDIDAIWLYLNGTLVSYYRPTLYGYYIEHTGSDGIVPVESQIYPGATQTYVVKPGPTHMREKQDERTIRNLALTLEFDFKVPRRLPGEVATVVVPAALSVPIGGSSTLTSQSYTIDGNLADSQVASWRSTNAAVATVTSSGASTTVTGVGLGNTLVIAENNGYADTTVITVTEAVAALTVTIDGPTQVNDGYGGTWQAVVNGGTGPYTYSWSGVLYGDAESISGQGNGTLFLDVWDSGGRHARASIEITTTYNCGGARICE